jgi:phenylpropionate dioxygenase-like ring-hydroxylating dioxygenase large terminal subunit
MLTPAENEKITRVSPGTPMGRLFRRYWLPALLASELSETDGPPVRVRLLGEDLIAFRDTSGAVGLVSAFCPHRRAPMFFGRNEECGLRCVYHGWKFDRHGACVDMPSEPPDSLFKTKVRIEAYPAREAGGMIWAYMGPPESEPPFPDYELTRTPESHRFVSKTIEDCNYLQAMEGGLDSSHATILHAPKIGDRSFLRDYDTLVPRLALEKQPYGYRYSGIRSHQGRQWVRVYHYVMPVQQLRGRVTFPTFGVPVPTVNGHFWVPADDTTTITYNWMLSYDPERPISDGWAEEFEALAGRGPDDLDPVNPFRLRRTLANDYLIDRHKQKTETFTGIEGLNTQDVALQEGMGPIVDRSREHLGTTDRAIIVLRQLLLEAADAVKAGMPPRGADPAAYRDIRPLDHIIDAGLDWRKALKKELQARF